MSRLMKVCRIPVRKQRIDLPFSSLASNLCRPMRAKLWDIDSVEEFDYILHRIYSQVQSFDSPRIAVNFTHGRHRTCSSTCNVVIVVPVFSVLNLRTRIGEQQYLSVGNTNDFSLLYKPLSDIPPSNTCLIIDISKATQRVSLEEKFRLERRSNHYLCKMSE